MAPLCSIGRLVVPVGDQDEALAFYRDVLGFEVLHDEEAGGFRYLHVGPPGETTGAWLFPGEPVADRPLLVLYSDDLEALRERLAAHGVETWAEREDADSRSLHLRDSAGNTLVAAELRFARSDEVP